MQAMNSNAITGSPTEVPDDDSITEDGMQPVWVSMDYRDIGPNEQVWTPKGPMFRRELERYDQEQYHLKREAKYGF